MHEDTLQIRYSDTDEMGGPIVNSRTEPKYPADEIYDETSG